ncbi:uncharacterized protein LOC144039197 [Vanacampus margaritifer]
MIFQGWSGMEVLSGPWAGLALLLRQTVTQTEREMDSFLPLWLFGLFLSICVLLLQLLVYLYWKLNQVEADLAGFSHDRSAIYRPVHGSAHKRRSGVAHAYT